MIMRMYKMIFFLIIILTMSYCKKGNEDVNEVKRGDSAIKLEINLPGSIQNPAFSPDGKKIVFTYFRNGYNKPPSDLYTYNLDTKELKPLIQDGNSNVNLPGECWNKTLNLIVFSSDREPHDEIYYVSANGKTGDEVSITARANRVAYEPTFSPTGNWIVFESHKLDEEENGIITKYRVDGTSGYINLTSVDDDCRQPNWSPDGDKILYQAFNGEAWNIWIMNTDGTKKRNVTGTVEGDKTDASFSPDGRWIVYSSDNGTLNYANIFIKNLSTNQIIQVTNYKNGYDGAPSWGINNKIIFESTEGEPDNSSGTTLWIIDAPVNGTVGIK